MIRLSKYFSKIKLDDDLYAIFNRFYFKVLYVNKDKLRKIKNYQVTDKEYETLTDYLIYTTEDMDLDTYNIMINKIEKEEDSIRNIYIIPTEFCNMNCDYCFVYKKQSSYKDKSYMTKETADIIIEKILSYINEVKYEKDNDLMIQFYGGEPTLNWNIIEYIVNELDEKDLNNVIAWSIITNGTNLNDSMLEYISKKNISVGLSIDGPMYINNVNRKYKTKNDEYNKIIKNLYKLVSHEIKVALSFTITDEVIKNKNKIIDWIQSSGLNNVNYNLLHFEDSDIDYIKKYYHEATNFIIDSYINIGDIIYEDRINRKISAFNDRNFKYSDCSAGLGKQITINADGGITYCNCDFLDNNKIVGNIKDLELKEILNFNSRKTLWINKLPIYNKKCIECDAIFICGGGCIAQLYDNDVDEGFCIHTKDILKWLLDINYLSSINI